jgi:hypothetical protein
VANIEWQILLRGLLGATVLVGFLTFSTLVVLSYLESRGQVRPAFDRSELARSLRRFAAWMGNKPLALVVRVGKPVVNIGKPVFNMLSEASAEVGEWFLGTRDHRI